VALRDYMTRVGVFSAVFGPGEFGLGLGASSRSGVRHEIDLVGFTEREMSVFEVKHYPGAQIDKSVISEFILKLIDMVCGTPSTYDYNLRLYLVTCGELDVPTRRLAMQWGITCVEPGRFGGECLLLWAGRFRSEFERGRTVPGEREVQAFEALASDLAEFSTVPLARTLPRDPNGSIWLNLPRADTAELHSKFERANEMLRSMRGQVSA
jgi:hypothetical protein